MKTDTWLKFITVIGGGVIVGILGIISSCNVNVRNASLYTILETETPEDIVLGAISNNTEQTHTPGGQFTNTSTPIATEIQSLPTVETTHTPEGGIITNDPTEARASSTTSNIETQSVPSKTSTLIIEITGTLPFTSNTTGSPSTTASLLNATSRPPRTLPFQTETLASVPKEFTTTSTFIATVILSTTGIPEAAQSIRASSSPIPSNRSSTLQEQLETLKNALDQAKNELDAASKAKTLLEEELQNAQEKLAKTEQLLQEKQGDESILEAEKQRLIELVNKLKEDTNRLNDKINYLTEIISIRLAEIDRLDQIINEEYQQKLWDILLPILGAISGVLVSIVVARVYSGVISVKMPSLVTRGSYATLDLHVIKGISCTPTINYKVGTDKILETKMQSSGMIGKLHWRWKIPKGARKGQASIRIQCFPSGKFLERDFTIK